MLMHQGLGLDRFNTLPRSRAIHALFECCCAVTWAEKIADARPYPTREALIAAVDGELLALSGPDLDRVFDSLVHERVSARTVQELSRIMHDHIEGLLGPAEGYPEY